MKKLISISLVVIMMITFIFVGNQPAYAQTSMTDLEGHWSKDYVQRLVDLGAINGYPDGTFKPNNTISRGAFIKVLCGVMDMKPLEKSYFEDTDGHWASGYIAAAVEAGLIRMEDYFVASDTNLGYYYYPDQNISREEIAVISVRALGDEFSAVSGGASSFTDAGQIEEVNKGYVTVCADKGIITGYPDNTFGPKKGATRAEASVVIGRIIDKMSVSDQDVLASNEIFKKLKPAMVKISGVIDGEESEIGSGFCISSDGKIVTNYHVISIGEEFYVEFENGTKKKVTSIHNYQRSKDIAVLNIEGSGYPVAPIGSSRSVNVGDTVYSMGYPLTMDLTIGNGILSSLQVDDYGNNFLLTTAPISPGSSGGVLLNTYGEVVGITQGTYVNGQNMNTCVPINDVIRVMTGQSQEIDIEEAYLLKAMPFITMDATLVGVKANGKMDVLEDGRMNMNDYTSLGLIYTASNVLSPQDDEIPFVFGVEDCYGDAVQIEVHPINIDEGLETSGEITFEIFDIQYIDEGAYSLLGYVGEELVVNLPLIIESDESYSEKGITSISIDTFTYESYGDTGNIVLKDRFHYSDNANVGFVLQGFVNASVFSDTGYEQVLVDIVVEGPNGNEEVISSMLYLQENGQFKITIGHEEYSIDSEDIDSWIGKYEVKVYYGDKILCEDSFTLHNDKSYTIQLLDKANAYYYNVLDEEVKEENYMFDLYNYIYVPVKLGQVRDSSSIAYQMVFRTSNEETASRASEEYSYMVTVQDSFQTIELGASIYLTNDMYIDYFNGETIYMDILIEGEVYDTIEIEYTEIESTSSVENAMVFTAESTAVFLESGDKSFDDYLSYDSEIIKADSEYLFYMINITSDVKIGERYIVDDIDIEFVNDTTGENLFEMGWIQEAVYNEKIMWIMTDSLSSLDIEPGTYTFRVLEDEIVIYEKTYTIE